MLYFFLEIFLDIGRVSGRSVRRVFPRIPHCGQRRGNMARILFSPSASAAFSSLQEGAGGNSPIQPQPSAWQMNAIS
jgi:hypothetical protein